MPLCLWYNIFKKNPSGQIYDIKCNSKAHIIFMVHIPYRDADIKGATKLHRLLKITECYWFISFRIFLTPCIAGGNAWWLVVHSRYPLARSGWCQGVQSSLNLGVRKQKSEMPGSCIMFDTSRGMPAAAGSLSHIFCFNSQWLWYVNPAFLLQMVQLCHYFWS